MAKFGVSKDKNNPPQTAQTDSPTTLDDLIASQESKPEPKAGSGKLITRTEADIAAEKLRQSRALPQPPGKNVTHEVMIDWLKLLTPNQRSRISIYIYRWKPVIIRQLVDETAQNNIDVIAPDAELPTIEYMIKVHGGGTYGFQLKDCDSNKVYFEASLQLPMTQYEPIFDLRELDVNHRDNRSYINKLKAEGRLDANNRIIEQRSLPTTTNSGSNAPALDVNGLVTTLLTNFTESQRQAMSELKRRGDDNKEGGISQAMASLVIKNMEQNDPAKLVNMLVSMMPKPTVDNSGGGLATMLPLLLKMMEMQSQQAQQNMTMMIEVMKNSSQKPASDPLAFMDRVLDFTQRRLLNNPQPEETTLDKVMNGVERLGPPILEVVMNAINAKNAANTGQQYVVPKPVAQMPVPQMPMQNTLNMGEPPMQAQPSVAIEQVDPGLVAMFKQYAPLLVNVISQNVDGASFGEQLETMVTLPVVSQIIAKGPKALLDAAMSVPELWQVVAPTPERAAYMQEWIEDFVNYKQIIAAMDTEGKAN